MSEMILELPVLLRRVIQVQALRNMYREEFENVERTLETVLQHAGGSRLHGVLISTPRGSLFASKSYGNTWRLLRPGTVKCVQVLKVAQEAASLQTTVRFLATKLTKKRGKITMAVVQQGEVAKHVNGYCASCSAADVHSFALAAVKMLSKVS